MSDELRIYWTRWAFETCLAYGADVATAAHVAGYFAEALVQ